jgi:hypothetical protein
MKTITLIIMLVFSTTGCIPMMVGGHYYRSTKTIEAKQKFLHNFNEINLQREKAGLQPLDICSEKRNIDPDWANDDPKCKVAETKS